MVEYWIYHERQQAALCGQHALNNLIQQNVFSPDSLAEIAYQLDQMELNYMAANNEGGIHSKDYLQRVAEGSGNVDEAGNFSIEVLRSALLNQYQLELPNIREEGVAESMDVTEMEGFICNKSSHWFAIRKINGHFWNLNSTADRPQVISHFRLAAEIQTLQDEGYSVFTIRKGLPPACTSEAGRSVGMPQYWWKEQDLISGKSNPITADKDPWKDVGSGNRLDGKVVSGNRNNISGLTEDELMQMAVAASLEQHHSPSEENNNDEKIAVPPEPAEGVAGVVKIQFRLPNGKRVVRRFLESDTVEVIYGFVQEECSSDNSANKRIELRYGFPPKDLASKRKETMKECNLAGEQIQGRFA